MFISISCSRSDIYVQADTFIGAVNATDGVFVAARLSKGGCDTVTAEGVYFFLMPGNGLIVTGDLGKCNICPYLES